MGPRIERGFRPSCIVERHPAHDGPDERVTIGRSKHGVGVGQGPDRLHEDGCVDPCGTQQRFESVGEYVR